MDSSSKQNKQFAPNIDRTRHLSPAQQGQILSDIQQHQHRFGIPSRQNFQPQQFSSSNSPFLQQPLPLEQQSIQQPNVYQQLPLDYNRQPQFASPDANNKETFARNEFLNALPLLGSVPPVIPTQQSSQIISQPPPSPTLQSLNNQIVFPTQDRVVQHHTQTRFEPNVSNNPQFQNVFQQQQYTTPRPTLDPIAAIEQQIRQLDPETHKQRIKELRDKQAIIEKHNQFVEKQYEKALKKAQHDHEVFQDDQKNLKKKLYEKLYKVSDNNNPIQLSRSSQPRLLFPEEASLFEQAVKQYYLEYPTTTTTSTTTTTPEPITTRKSTKQSKNDVFLPTALPQIKAIQSLEDLDQLQKEYKSQRIRKDDLLEQLRIAISKSQDEDISKTLSSREISLANGKKVQLIAAPDDKIIPNGKEQEITLPDGKKVTVVRADDAGNKGDEEVILPSGHQLQIIQTNNPKILPNGNTDIPQEITLPNGQKAQLFKPGDTQPVSSHTTSVFQEITLPNGEKVEVIRTSDPNLVPGGVKLEPGSELEKLVLSRTTTSTTIQPPKAIIEELNKNDPNAKYEILKTGASGSLESLGKNIPDQKKVTFVLLEEQSDGTLKVKGVKGNGKDKPDIDVDSILKKIKQGDIKLPSRETTTTASTTTVRAITTYKPYVQATITPNAFASNEEDSTVRVSTFVSEDGVNVPILKTNIGTHLVASSTPNVISSVYPSSSRSTSKPSPPAPELPQTTTKSSRKSSRNPHILTNHNRPNDLIKQASTVQSANQNSLFSSSTYLPKPTLPSVSTSSIPNTKDVNIFPTRETYIEDPTKTHQDLPDILRKNGLYAMAKFLGQSGLDTILNETGPYTLFVPTDKAFRTLLVQLGGPERAEDKFKENPRLLSGLLLHHVIPGAFQLSNLQDEMTGVSLAGTQLRVNQYSMHDLEWNDIKITTINGAKILEEKKDIEIPQGYAHSIDRVMFPLPVGDIVQTLQSDRERRFTSFLRAVFASGLAEMLQGTRTFTLFAPTEKAFAGLSTTDLSRMVTDKVLARELVLKHLISGTLYTNGMRYYQIKNSLLEDQQITLSKQSGKTKVNNNSIITQNIPSTNGVIHAIDSLL